MHRIPLFISFVATISVAILFGLAERYDLLWRIWWYDIPLHFLGGVALGGLAIWSIHAYAKRENRVFTGGQLFLWTLLLVLIAGLLWELQEYLSGNTFNTIGNYPLDTFKDLIMDLLGGALAYWLGNRRSPIVSASNLDAKL